MNLSNAINGELTDCIQLTYRTPRDSVRSLLPEGLELVTRGPWALWNIMLSRVEHVRPLGIPAWCGVGYTQVSYRLMVQAMTDRAEVIRGLYFVRSDVSARAVSLLGNMLSDFHLHKAAVELDADDCGAVCKVSGTECGRADVLIDTAHAPASLLDGSCFPSTEDARQFCAFMPTSLNVDDTAPVRRLRITQVLREQATHTQTPMVVRKAKLSYFETIGQDGVAELEWACRYGPENIKVLAGKTAGLLMQPRQSKHSSAPLRHATPAIEPAAS